MSGDTLVNAETGDIIAQCTPRLSAQRNTLSKEIAYLDQMIEVMADPSVATFRQAREVLAA